jgi:pilus assembly protein Flp/PilA
MEVNAIQELYVRAAVAFRSFRDREEGQGLVEYALILSLVSIAAIVILGVLGTDVTEVFDTVENSLNGDG